MCGGVSKALQVRTTVHAVHTPAFLSAWVAMVTTQASVSCKRRRLSCQNVRFALKAEDSWVEIGFLSRLNPRTHGRRAVGAQIHSATTLVLGSQFVCSPVPA